MSDNLRVRQLQTRIGLTWSWNSAGFMSPVVGLTMLSRNTTVRVGSMLTCSAVRRAKLASCCGTPTAMFGLNAATCSAQRPRSATGHWRLAIRSAPARVAHLHRLQQHRRHTSWQRVGLVRLGRDPQPLQPPNQVLLPHRENLSGNRTAERERIRSGHVGPHRLGGA